MPCLKPLMASLRPLGGKPAIHKLKFTEENRAYLREKEGASYVELPCGQCLHCRLSYSRHWAVRCMHESQMHTDNIFLTLTYAPEHLPAHGSLDKKAVPAFMADLRREIGHKNIKYFHCGEYGDKLSRPHYHVLIFGWRPRDARRLNSRKSTSYPLYTSETIERLWPWGYAPFGELSFESAAYTARYATKKITGKKAASYYDRGHDPDTGEVIRLQPEYATMSNRGGIGRCWLERYMDEVYPSDTVLVNGHLVQPPRFYDKVLEKHNPDLYKEVKKNRLLSRDEKPILTIDQLADFERALKSRFNQLMRNIE